MKRKLKKKYKIISFLLLGIILSVIAIVLLKKIEVYNATVTCLNIDNQNEIELMEEKSFQLNIKPSKDKFKNHILFQSQNPEIVEVNKDGLIECHQTGETTIQVSVDGSKNKLMIKVSGIVNPSILKGIDIDGIPKETMKVGKKYRLKPIYSPITTEEKEVEWQSSNEKIITVNNEGLVSVLGEGEATITLTGKRNLIKEVQVKTEKEPEITKLDLIGNNVIDLECNEKYQMAFNGIGEELFHLISFNSSNANVVSVDKKGVIKAIRPGNAFITAKAKGKNISVRLKINAVCNNGLLSNDDINIGKANKLMIVAHPDDETLWGGGHLLDGNWFVVCLTHGFNNVRRNEFYNAMSVSQSNRVILSYPDITNGQRDNWNSVSEGIKKDLEKIISLRNWEQIATHSPRGETGHIHHKNTNKIVTEVVQRTGNINKLWYFGKFYSAGNVPDTLIPTNDENKIKMKELMLSKYVAEQAAIEKYWRQMVPFEYWEKAN